MYILGSITFGLFPNVNLMEKIGRYPVFSGPTLLYMVGKQCAAI